MQSCSSSSKVSASRNWNYIFVGSEKRFKDKVEITAFFLVVCRVSLSGALSEVLENVLSDVVLRCSYSCSRVMSVGGLG